MVFVTSPDYRREFEKERQRLAQLWDAYEDQEKETNALQEKVNQLEIAIYDRDKRIEAMNEMMAGGASEKTALNLREASNRQVDHEYQAEIERLNEVIRVQRDNFSKVFAMSEDLDDGLMKARAEIKERDRIIAQNKIMLESKDKQLQMLRPR